MSAGETRFTPLQRTLHWLMAAMVLAMLFIGVGMVSTLQPKFLTLFAIHRPLGITILVLVSFRLSVRLWRGTPRAAERPALLAGICRQSLPLSALWTVDRHAADRLVDALGRGLSDRPLWADSSAENRAAQRRAICSSAERPYLARVLVLRDCPSSSQCGPIPRPNT